MSLDFHEHMMKMSLNEPQRVQRHNVSHLVSDFARNGRSQH